jgi:hypothetical protein
MQQVHGRPRIFQPFEMLHDILHIQLHNGCRRFDAVQGDLLRIEELLAAGLIAESLHDYSMGVLGSALC